MSGERNNSNFVISFLIVTSLFTIATLLLYPRNRQKSCQILKTSTQALSTIWGKNLQRLKFAIAIGIKASQENATAQENQ